MKMNRIYIFLIYTMMLALPAIAEAQVTIGAAREPREGALLDLKEEDSTKKGLGLPRVALSEPGTFGLDKQEAAAGYAGMTVYNVTNNGKINEGIYCWNGNRWMQAVMPDSIGEDGRALTSNGDGTYSWTSVPVPTFNFYKPTQVLAFESKCATSYTYSYADMTNAADITSSMRKPYPSVFAGKYAYKGSIDIKTNGEKYALLRLSLNVRKKTNDGTTAIKKSIWEYVQIEVFLDKEGKKLVKNYANSYTTPEAGYPTLYVNWLSTIDLKNVAAGSYPLWIKVSILQNIYAYNSTDFPPSGNFAKSSDFCTININDFGLVLFELDDQAKQ